MFHRPNSTSQAPAKGETETMAQTTNETQNDTQTDANRSVDIPAAGAASGGNPFQRPNAAAGAASATPARNPMPNYGSNYPSYGASSSGVSSSSTAQGRRLVIGEGITMSGEIESCDVLVVEGTVEAALKGASALEVAEKGMFYGTVEINEATIAGKFEGELTVNGRLTIRGTGSVVGAISYKELAVEAGAVIDGKINPVGGSRAGASDKKSRKQNNNEELPILQRASA